MNLADKSCYPSQVKIKMGESLSIKTSYGLTLRERLILALASNPELIRGESTIAHGITKIEYDITAATIIHQADAIIKQLEEEKK